MSGKTVKGKKKKRKRTKWFDHSMSLGGIIIQDPNNPQASMPCITIKDDSESPWPQQWPEQYGQ